MLSDGGWRGSLCATQRRTPMDVSKSTAASWRRRVWKAQQGPSDASPGDLATMMSSFCAKGSGKEWLDFLLGWNL